ncbi:TPA: sterol desaturase family protein [Raoultella planticola]
MIDDSQIGKRNKRGDWQPNKPAEYPPVFTWPAKPVAFLKWLITSYLFPWNFIYAGTSIIVWLYLTPSLSTMTNLEFGWASLILLRNAGITLFFYGAWHFRLYIQKKQGHAFKFNSKWPSKDNSAFLFRRQTPDNIIWTFVSGVPLWTAFEVLMLWAFSNGWIAFVSWEEHPWYCSIVMFFIPMFRDIHFYLVHRMLHWPPLYRWIHYLHHNNVNPGPWSGLSMHPGEHFFYFTCVLIHMIVPSHPLHAIFNLMHAGMSPAQGHLGYDKVVFEDGETIDTGAYTHYLHHKYFECNYADGVVPLDKWFGTFHDGSKEAQQKMDERFMQRASEVNKNNGVNEEKGNV